MYLKGVQAFQKYDPLTNLTVSQGHLCYLPDSFLCDYPSEGRRKWSFVRLTFYHTFI